MMSQASELLILGADYSTGNMGVDALLSGTVASALNAAPTTRIRLLTYGHGSGQGNGIAHVNLRFSWKLHLVNNVMRLLGVAMVARVAPWRALREKLLDGHPVLREIEGTSQCVAIAGGDSFSDIYGLRRFAYICLPQVLVLAMGRPLVLLPQTLGPFKSRFSQGVAGWIMRRATVVFSRDLEGLQVARQLTGPASDLRFSWDMGFALQPQAPAAGCPAWLEAPVGPVVGLNVSGLLFAHPVRAAAAFGLKGSYRDVLEALVLWLTNEMQAEVMLVTHVTGAGESDALACEELFNAVGGRCCGRLHLADRGYNHREIKHLIGKCEFFIGARMHACIAALSQGIPAAGMAYSRKFAGVYESIEAGAWVVDLREHEADAVLDRLKNLFLQRKLLAAELARPAALACSCALGLFNHLAANPNPPSPPPPANHARTNQPTTAE
jgi:polysaccharide pyruvyl transferase WcaK-like protein